MANLPVRAMILYKHGVGFFVREGTFDGTAVELNFRRDEINDVLKSLTVIDQSGGQVQGIHYQTPMDKWDRLATSSIRLNDQSSLRDLIMNLRGREASIFYRTSTGERSVTGRIVGLDEPHLQDREDIYSSVTVLEEGGRIQVVDLQSLISITVQDEQSQQDLHFFLDTSMGDSLRQTINVRLSEGAHHLTMHYVAPSPVWRVSYRLVAESEKDTNSGQALLQGWGLFDNRLEEDLEDVHVTLVAGQPISFIYDLYSSQIPIRPTVKDEARIAPGPIMYEEADEIIEHAIMPPAAFAAEDSRFFRKAGAAAPRAAGMAAPAPAPISRQQAAATMQTTATAKESGEFFQYEVTTPVNVKRGESALVPIIGDTVNYQRELLYNGAKLPNHPVAALRFKNTTGLTLERGPVTVVEDGDYKGEAVVPFTKSESEVYLPYAVELGIKVTENPKNWWDTIGLSIRERYLVYEQHYNQQVTYVLENTTQKLQTVTIEAAITPNYDLFDTPNPAAETTTERRWRVEIPAKSRREFVRQERQKTSRREDIANLDFQKLSNLLKNRYLDQAMFDWLAELLRNIEQIKTLEQEQEKLYKERDQLYVQQNNIRSNLTTLKAEGQEAQLRNRFLSDLEKSQNRMDAIEARLQELEQQRIEAEARITEILEGLAME